MPAIALISDIHGNLPALEAVLADIRRSMPDAVYVAGDLVNGCPWPAEVIDIVTDSGWPAVMGNHDDAVLQLGTPRMEARYKHQDRYGALWWTRRRVSSNRAAFLEQLPLERVLTLPEAPAVRLMHGVPGNFFLGIRPDAPGNWVAETMAVVAETTVLVGHTHVPAVRQFDRWLVVNAGSVGAPYDGDARASYARLVTEAGEWRAEIRRVEYDLAAVDEGFRATGLLSEGGVMSEMFRRSVMTGLPWVADFVWWMRDQPAAVLANMQTARRMYDARHGPGHWSFPYA